MKHLIWPTFILLSSTLAWAANPAGTGEPAYYRIEAFLTLEDSVNLTMNLTFDQTSSRLIRVDTQCSDRLLNLVPCVFNHGSIDKDFVISLHFQSNTPTKLESLKINLVRREITVAQNARSFSLVYENLPRTDNYFRIESNLTAAEARRAPHWLLAPKPATNSITGLRSPAGPEIHRWIFEYQGTMMLIEILEQDGSAVLTQFAKHQPPLQFADGPLRERNLDLRAVRRFSIVEPAPPLNKRGFKLEFNPRRTLLKNKRTQQSKLMVPIAMTLYPRETSTLIEGRFASPDIQTLRWQGSYWKRPSSETSFTLKIPNARLVLEPKTLYPVAYDDYFLPKQIQMPSNYARNWPSQSWPELINGESWKTASVPEIANVRGPNDLILGGRLNGHEAEVFKLLQQIDKPTIAEFLHAIGGESPKPGESNPFSFYANPPFVRTLEASTPGLIALFEQAYSGAHFYGLGRDIYLLSDILDAYFTSRGQPGRVTRLPASAPSFFEASPELVMQFLQTFGYDLPKPGVPEPAKIIFDVTSYSNGAARFSQSRQLMRAVYTQIAALGLNQKDFLHHFNFISTGGVGGNVRPVDSKIAIQNYFSSLEVDSDGPKTIMQIYNDRGLQYTNAWHDVYGQFVRDPSGKVIAPPGRPGTLRTKLIMLSELWVLTQTVMQESFHNLVLRQNPGACSNTLSTAP